MAHYMFDNGPQSLFHQTLTFRLHGHLGHTFSIVFGGGMGFAEGFLCEELVWR